MKFTHFPSLNGLKKGIIATVLMASSAFTLLASSHREAPLIANDPLADNVDVYAFRSPDKPNTVTLIATYVPMQLPQGGPNYHSFGENIRYEIHVDNDASKPGDEIVYRFTFTKTNEDPTTFFNIRLGKQNLKTTYKLERSMDGGKSFMTVIAAGIVPPPNIGARSIESGAGLGKTYSQLMSSAITATSSGEQVFCGPSDDPFFVDLGGIFDLGDAPRQNGRSLDGLACLNVSTIAIQVPIAMLLKTGAAATPTNILDPNYVIGVWASASRRAIRTLSAAGDEQHSGDWVQVSRLGMPLTNEAVIPIGRKDFWNRLTPYDELAETTLDEYFYNPELALYMDDALFGTAVPSLAPLRVQRNSLQGFDFGNGKNGLFALKGSAAVKGTALDDAVFGTLLLPAAGKPRSVDLWPIFHTGVPNVIPYQLATGKNGNPLAKGKPFIHNFLPNGGDMLRLNMAVPVTPRNDPNFSPLGIVAAAVAGLTNPAFNGTTDLQNMPNMDGFPNGRRLEDDVTRIELQAVGGVALAAIGLWYDDYKAGSANPVTPNLLKVLTFTTGVEANDAAFQPTFPYVAMPWRGTSACGGNTASSTINSNAANSVDIELGITADKPTYNIYENTNYTVTLTNKGGIASGKVKVAASLPKGMVYTDAKASKGQYNLFLGEWSVDNLNPSESVTLKLVFFTLVKDTPITNFVQVSMAEKQDIDSTPGNAKNQTPSEDDEAAVTITPATPKAQVTEKPTLAVATRSSEIGVMNIFPNPVATTLTANIVMNKATDTEIHLLNYEGKRVADKLIQAQVGMNEVSFDVSNLPTGMYFMNIVGQKGENATKKFVVVQ
jgi:uncharacterized repeat protein (TIGR01451 family)